jgi:uncharacterized protein
VTFLLDVNLLIAILDPDHVHHDLALGWYNDIGYQDWATCPIVQNGVVRIVGSQGYASVPFGCTEVANILAEWCAVPEHRFWPDNVSLLDKTIVDRAGLTSPDRITDVYLLALAATNGGRLATLDRRLSPAPVQGGAAALHLIH